MSVTLSNCLSTPSAPATGVLQGSVLSPHLYSIYINSLPGELRVCASNHTTKVGETSVAINALLFADDVALIGSATKVQAMLDIASDHSLRLGYRWSPSKCAVLNADGSHISLYGETLPQVDEFVYQGVPFIKQGMSTEALIRHRSSGTILAMAALQAIGARPSGFSALLSSYLYRRQFIRPKFEYALAICRLTATDSKALEDLQNRCPRMMTGGHRTSSTVTRGPAAGLSTSSPSTTCSSIWQTHLPPEKPSLLYTSFTFTTGP
ncbi:hypothetical protein K450DRAFT_267808 [Umbelopsis ramanniana AG]|uniref:Reverse transcriptase domain-containing protein n=1 Tax=Umbelopsis ramanniana AG TaxID=1314678 RepID=A0AAD5HGS0_UMBRA|nr:uncharacterized protein K450DRAFT_267808 [Umbelopsis ramanniana AG]KAI8583785.1 hypothetical protein K450DRAFT_267808 [Umbelopsis ramanniana AG]